MLHNKYEVANVDWLLVKLYVSKSNEILWLAYKMVWYIFSDLIVQAKSGTGKTCVFVVIALESICLESLTPHVRYYLYM